MKMEARMQLQNIGPAIGKGKIIQVVKQYSKQDRYESPYILLIKSIFFILAYRFEKTSVEFALTRCSHSWLYEPDPSQPCPCSVSGRSSSHWCPLHSNAWRHSGEGNQYCVVLASIVLCFPRSPGQGINTMEIWGSSGNDLLPKGLNSTSVYPFCFRFDGGFTLFWEVAWTLSIFSVSPEEAVKYLWSRSKPVDV